ncbi:MAG: sensor histidine kinase [Erythrobacter sp.]
MHNDLPVLPSDMKTIAELRDLYRAAESRAARLRLLSVSGSELARADLDTLDEVLQSTADRLAFFVGARSATIGSPDDASGLPIRAPGQDGENLATIAIADLSSVEAISDSEDREAVRMQLDLMGITIDRMRREREKTALLSALQEREKSLEMLLERIFTAQEEERRRVSHELHDGVAQTATALVRLLEGPEVNRDNNASGPDAISPAEVARVLVSELRRVIAGLRPTLLDDLGLMPALQSLADALDADGYHVAVDLGSGEERLSSLMETALYRVAQEAVANIRKHAGGPCEVTIYAQFGGDGGGLLRITDNGRGPSAETLAESSQAGNNVGIDVMKERMAAIGGTLDWRGARDKGVVVEARLPKRD